MSLRVPFHKFRVRLSLLLQLTLLWCATPTLAEPNSDSSDSAPPKKIAAIVTTYFPNSHAGVLVDKFLRGFPTDDGVIPPRMTISSLYIDQIHEQDIGRQVAKQFDVPLFESIRDALTLGGDTLAVDAVLLVGEHGNYPKTKLGQEMLPRRYFFEQILGVIGESHRAVPVFNDKFLAYRWDDAHWMYETAKSMHVPLWAGSSLPVVWRSPNWEHPAETPISEALVLGMHMVERYGFHALEILQSQVERRTGGECGVRSVQCLSGDAVWQAGKAGQWSETLANAALHSIKDGPQHLDPSQIDDPHVFLIEYCDGLRAAVLMLGDGFLKSFAYAETDKSAAPTALEYISATGPANAAFSYLGLNVEDFFLTQSPPSPLERTLLTTGILEAALISRHQNGARIETPHLAKIQYKPFGNPRRPQATHPSNASTSAWNVLVPGETPAADSIPIVRNGTVRGPRANRN